MTVNYKEVVSKGLGRCLYLNNGTIECAISLDYGPRILRFGYIDEENLFYDQSKTVVNSNLGTWNLIGGHRLAHSPEAIPRTYVPDNEEVSYERVEHGVRLIQEKEKWTGISKEIIIRFEANNSLKVIHHMTNYNPWAVELALWGITLMRPGGIELIPLSRLDTKTLPNRNIVFWPYTQIEDKRLTYHNDYIMLTHDTTIQKPLKIGTNNDQGWAVYLINKYLFIKRFEVVKDGVYPDSGVNYETYANGEALEMESLSPIYKMEYGERRSHVETWEIVKDISQDIKTVIEHYL